jgi:hypothetical protein
MVDRRNYRLPKQRLDEMRRTPSDDAKCFFFIAICTTLVASYRLAIESHSAFPSHAIPHVLKKSKHRAQRYTASTLEQYIIDHSIEMGLDTTNGTDASGCDLWRNVTTDTPVDATRILLRPPPTITDTFHRYRQELKEYSRLVADFTGPSLDSYQFRQGLHLANICNSVLLHPLSAVVDQRN